MSFIGIILIFILGFSILGCFKLNYSLLEYIGGGFPVGMGMVTFFMFFMNVVGIAFNQVIMLSLIALSILIFNSRFILKPQNAFGKVKQLDKSAFFYFGRFNLVWLIFVLLIIAVLAAITAKNLYWPTTATDSVSSFDLYAKAIAQEGELINSLIRDKSVGYGAAYPPFYTLSLSYSYILGFESSKIIPALFFISFVILFYTLLLKNVSSTGAAITTLLMMITPELLAQSAINTTSVTQSMLGSLGLISLFTWSNNSKENKYLLLSVLLLALNAWTRSEGIVYIGASFIFYLYVLYKEKKFIKPFIFLLITTLPFIVWQLFLKGNANLMDSFVQAKINLVPNIEMGKIQEILHWTKFNFFHPIYYGITIYVFLASIILNILSALYKKQSLIFLVILLIPLIGYLLLINQIELRSDTIEAIMKASAKRFFFGFVVLMWFYFAYVFPFNKLFSVLDKYLGLPQNDKIQANAS